MKTKIFFTSMALCAMMISLVSCEPTTLGKKNVLINLAELGDKINGKSIEEMENIISRKGFTKCYEWSRAIEDEFNGTYVYANGIQIDSTWFGEDVTSKINLQEDNACILVVDYSKYDEEIHIDLAACYILPNNPIKDYKTISNNLYRYCSTNYSFKVSTEDPEECARGYMWYGDIDTDSTYLDYSNDDEFYQFALQAGWMTQEEYNEEMAYCEDKSRADFVEQLKCPFLAVYEEMEAADIIQNKFMYAGLLLSEGSDSFFEADGVMMAECYWVGYELVPPTPTQKRFVPRGKKHLRDFIGSNNFSEYSSHARVRVPYI